LFSECQPFSRFSEKIFPHGLFTRKPDPQLTTDDTDSAIYGDTDNTDNGKKKYPRNPKTSRRPLSTS
jgi:hypothetical protein